MAAHSGIFAWEIPRAEKPGGLQSVGSQRVRRDLATKQQANRAEISVATHDKEYRVYRLSSKKDTKFFFYTIKKESILFPPVSQSLFSATTTAEASLVLCWVTVKPSALEPVLFNIIPGRIRATEKEEQGHRACRKLRSADVTFPRNQPALVPPIIIHHFVYKWEIALSCSLSSKRLKLIWNNPPAKAPITASGMPWCHPLWLLTRHYWYTNQSWLLW